MHLGDFKISVKSNVAIFIPTLNEQQYIASVIDRCLESDCDIYVVDGGSQDDTRVLVNSYIDRFSTRVFLLNNPNRTQAYAMREFLSYCANHYKYVIRLDAHSKYNPDYIDNICELLESGVAESIVVPMETIGDKGLQIAASYLFNSILGTGGSQHRVGTESGYVDHGHHAGFTMKSLKANGGYDPYFDANEDAEYDFRLVTKGGRIFMSVENKIGYYPRKDYKGFYKQYVKYGFYRAANLLKHKSMPKVRQLLPVGVFLSFLMAIFSIFIGVSWFSVLCLGLLSTYFLTVLFLAMRMKCGFKTKLRINTLAIITHISFGFGFMMRCFGLKRPIGI